MPFSSSEKETTVPPAAPETADESSTDSSVLGASLPKLVVCFDINTLRLEDLKAIASDLKVADYDHMTQEELCNTLTAL